ncbi:MAG: cytidylate kinase family protein, partial [Sediminibacterium sp.]|nr:cytidylate kinase family protein [Sediminibacterium sp.]
MHITITGDLGSGKTTVAKKLCEILHYTYFSTGKIQREIAAQRKTNTLNLNYIAENDSSIDEYIDNQLI